MTTSALSTPKDYALYYRNQLGFSVFIVKSYPPTDRKKPVLEWKAYQNRLASLEEIEGWFRFANGNYNIAAVTGNISKIVALDIDGPTATARVEEKRIEMSTNLRVALDNTMMDRTGSGKGKHIIFRIEEPTNLSTKVLWSDGAEHSEIKLQANGRYIVLPPSIHESGNRYEWNGKAPHLITTQELNELIRLLSANPRAAHADKTVRNSTKSSANLSDRTLSAGEIEQILYWLRPYYTPGNRNYIIFYLSGMLRKSGFVYESARALIRELCNSSGYADEDLAKSLDVVDNTYDKPLEELNGKSGLRNVLVTSHEDTVSTEEEYLRRTEAFARICQIINYYNSDNNDDDDVEPKTTKTTKGKEGGGEEEETRKEKKVRELTEQLEQKYHFAAMEDTEELFYYVGGKGKYEPASAFVKSELEKLAPGVLDDTITNVLNKLARRHFHKRTEFDADLYTLNMANGLYDIKANTLREHTWEYLSLRQIPVRFNPDARSRKFGKFLSEVLYPNQTRTAVEAMAYTFLRDNPFETYVILVGFGSNGKSVLMHVLTKLHGEDNVSNTSLTNLLTNRFAKKELEGKNVNIDMEMSRATIDDMSVLKELTGSQPIRIEPKYLQAYTTRLWAKHFFSTNEMPDMKDYTDAHYRREILISFPNQFVDGVNANPNLKHELTTDEELSGIFNALVIPLRRIAMEQKPPYMDAKTIHERKLKHQLMTDPIKAFLEIAVEPTDYDSDPDISKEDLYELYKKFCAFYKLPWQKYDPFCGAVKTRGYKDGREPSGDRKRVWKGMRLNKSLFEDPLTS